MKLTIIAAMSENRVIGKNNDLIWHLPDDLKHFKDLTKGHHVIMGRKTFESMNKKPLPHRVNIIVTRDKTYKAPGCILVHTLEDGIQKAEGDNQPFVIGGGKIYKQAMDYARVIELTIVRHKFKGDTYFPLIDEQDWKKVREEHHEADEKHRYSFDFVRFERK